MPKNTKSDNFLTSLSNQFSAASLMIIGGMDLAAGYSGFLPAHSIGLGFITLVVILYIDGYIVGNFRNEPSATIIRALAGGVLVALPTATFGLLFVGTIGALKITQITGLAGGFGKP